MELFSEIAKKFYQDLSEPDIILPEKVECLLPFTLPSVQKYLSAFYDKYYADHRLRTLILGINPGRHGAGVTGIPFTDPVQLERKLKIPNTLPKRTELSAIWVHQLMDEMGGPKFFCNDFYLSSVSPVGFIKNGKNFNYYDDKTFAHTLEDYIIQSLHCQLNMPLYRHTVICWGKGKNATFLLKLNQRYRLFKKVCILPHPRWIMQYKRKNSQHYLELVANTLQTCRYENEKTFLDYRTDISHNCDLQ